ncbi:MAG TPA: hypothetical protein VGO46_08870 [Gemmatimonadaceae bacterium]|jgi:hypothetical protein|nr:hypothetical protein [Gemmatimonadaceae bacterium]
MTCAVVFAMSFAASSASIAQTASQIEIGDARRVTQIRKWTAAVTQNLSRDSVVKLDLSGFSLEGGELSAYFAHDTLRKLDAFFFRETGRTREEYFFGDDGRFVSMKSTVENYDVPMSGTVVRTYRARYSFDGERLIQWVDSTGKSRKTSGTEADANTRDARRTGKALVDCVRTLKSGETCEASDSSSVN